MRRVFEWGLALLLGAAVGAWGALDLLQRGATPTEFTAEAPAPAMPVPAIPEAPAPAMPVVSSHATAAPLPEAPATDAPILGYDGADWLERLPGLLDDVALKAEAGDPRALAELADWLDYCQLATTHEASTRRPDYPGPGDVRDTGIRAHYQQVGSACGAWYARHHWLNVARQQAQQAMRDYSAALYALRGVPEAKRPSEPRALPDLFRLRAAEAGDLAAMTRATPEQLRNPCGTPAPGDRQMDCRRERAREALAGILASRDPALIAAVPAVVGSMALTTLWNSEFFRLASVGSNYQHSEAGVLWQLAACEFGLDCSASGPLMRLVCIRQGICRYTNYRDYLRDRVAPPAVMRDIEWRLPRLVSLILAKDVDGILGPPTRY